MMNTNTYFDHLAAGGLSRRVLQSGLLVALALALSVAGLAPVHAQAHSVPKAQASTPVAVELVQFKVIKGADGKEQFLPADAVMPGDIIEYRATYRNTTTKPVSGMAATLPIPQGTDYLPRSASAPGGLVAEAATAGGSFGREPLTRKVKGPDGKLHDEPVPYAEYRMLRWNIDRLNGKGELTVTARVRIEGGESPASGAASARTPRTGAQEVSRTPKR